MNKEVDLQYPALKVKGLKYDVIIYRGELRNPIICIYRILPIILSHDIAVRQQNGTCTFGALYAYGDAARTFWSA